MDETQELFAAIGEGDLDRVRAIIAECLHLTRCKNADTLSALVFARYIGDVAVLDALVAAGPALDIFEAAQLDRAGTVRELLDVSPESVLAYSDDGFTALHFAGYYGAPHALKLLLARGANPEAVTKNFLTNMALHAAAAGGHIDCCEILLERGADVNARQHSGFTPLHTAGFRDDRKMAELFLRHGADASAKNDEGQTPVDSARSQGHTQIAALLRARE